MKDKKLLLGLVAAVLLVVLGALAFQNSDGSEDLQGSFRSAAGPAEIVDLEPVDTGDLFEKACDKDECDLMGMLEDMEESQVELLDAIGIASNDVGTVWGTSYGAFSQTSEILFMLDMYNFHNIQTSSKGSLQQTSEILYDLENLEDLINSVCGS